jgi:catechol 2,3-dioxygenase-like lactoylglutathione lyase family enzyme
MIPGTLYETHIKTKNIEVAIEFYQNLGLELAHFIEERRVAFFWFNKDNKKEQMLGVWEVPEDQFKLNHFAFKVTYEEIINSTDWLNDKGIQPISSFGYEPTEPIVMTWMPAAMVYFLDPDGNELEFISILEEGKKPNKDILYLSEWNEYQRNTIY